MRKPSLPPIQILESVSSSYADGGPTSTESASSPSSQQYNVHVSQKKKLRTRSAMQQRTSRYYSKGTDGSMNMGHYPYTTKHHTEMNEYPIQNYQTVYPGPILHTGPPMGTIPVVTPLETYQYMNQSPYYPNPNIAYMVPAANYPCFYQNYQIPPQMSPIPLRVYHPHHNYGQNFPSPISKHPGHVIPKIVVSGRETPFHDRLHSMERGSDTLRHFTNSHLKTEEGSFYSYKNLTQQEGKHEYQALRSSKSLKNLRSMANTPSIDAKSNRTKLSKHDENDQHQNKISGRGLPAYKTKNQTASQSALKQKEKENILNETEQKNNTSKVGRVRPVSNADTIGNRALNDISRINEVSARTRKPPIYHDESEGMIELNNTEHSIVQKLGGGFSNINSLENNEDHEMEIKSTLSKRNAKVSTRSGNSEMNLKSKNNETTKVQKGEKIEVKMT